MPDNYEQPFRLPPSCRFNLSKVPQERVQKRSPFRLFQIVQMGKRELLETAVRA